MPEGAGNGQDRKYRSESARLDLIHTLGFRQDLDMLKSGIQGQFYTTCAFSAVGPPLPPSDCFVFAANDSQAMQYLEVEHLIRFASCLRCELHVTEDDNFLLSIGACGVDCFPESGLIRGW
jgi:hypothetical protein